MDDGVDGYCEKLLAQYTGIVPSPVIHVLGPEAFANHLYDQGICRFFGCTSKPYAKGMCSEHYNNWLYHRDGSAKCSVKDCELRPRRAKLCYKHYEASLCKDRCSIGGCSLKAKKEGLCIKHYKINHGKCSVPECTNKKVYSLNPMLCNYHYKLHIQPKKTKKGKKTKDKDPKDTKQGD